MINTFELEKAIEKNQPALPYDYALWCSEMSAMLAGLSKNYADMASREMDRITRDKIESELFEIVYPVESKQAVNLAKLKEEQPKVYAKIVHLKPADAAKLIGENKLYKLAAKAENYDSKLDVVTLQDLKKQLGKKAPLYIKTVYNTTARMIVPKGTYHDPRELPEAEA